MTTLIDDYIKELAVMDERMAQAAERLAGKKDGLTPFETHYKLVTDRQMVQITAYTMMPRQYRSWKFGKAAHQWQRQMATMHIFESVINTDPSYCHLSTTNPLARQLQVMAHAKYGHVDFFANNYKFAETRPDTVLSRFAQHANYVDALCRDPHWGRQAVDHILDAAHALQQFCGIVPSLEDQKSEKELRDELMDQLTELRQKERTIVSSFDRELVGKQIRALERRLARNPLRPERDLLKFLIDAEMNPHLPPEARNLLSIVREQGRYFRPQGETKFMNEGWANYWERNLLVQPELDLPFDIHLELCSVWTGHEQMATNWYFDPYALGRSIFDYIDRKYGFDEGSEKVKVEILGRNAEGRLVNTGRFKEVEVVRRNRDKMFEVRRNYDDIRFLNEFLATELFEEINLKALKWVRKVIANINRLLGEQGYGPQVIFDPIPSTLEGMMKIISTWADLAEAAEAGFQQMGMPRFPIPVRALETMATILQVVAAYDEDKHLARKMLIKRMGAGFAWLPNIAVIDTGRYGDGDGVLTLKHTYDPDWGPLLESECRDTLRYFRRLCGQPVRLLTKEFKKDFRGRPTDELVDYMYFTKDGIEIEEGVPEMPEGWLERFE